MPPNQLWRHTNKGFPIQILPHLQNSYLDNTPYKPRIPPKILTMVWWPTTTRFGWVEGGNKTVLKLLDKNEKTLLEGLVLNNNLAFLGPCWSLCWSDPFLPLYLVLVSSYIFINIYLPVHLNWWALRYPSTWYFTRSLCPSSLSVYQYTGVHPWASNLAIYTIKPVGYPWYISMSLSQQLTWVYISLLVL